MQMSHQDFTKLLNFIEKDITLQQISGGKKFYQRQKKTQKPIDQWHFNSLALPFHTHILIHILEVCNAILKNMQSTYLKVSSTTQEWFEIAAKFEKRWQYPHCIGAFDCKHLVMQPPPDAGSKFYNYKHTHIPLFTW